MSQKPCPDCDDTSVNECRTCAGMALVCNDCESPYCQGECEEDYCSDCGEHYDECICYDDLEDTY